MIKKEIINGKLFLTQTTFYVYDSEDGNVKDEIPILITSDIKTFRSHKKYYQKIKNNL
jgi:hypothetical protein